MSTIFLSHSSRNLDWAERVQERLKAAGHTVFLDADPQGGILAGVAWERKLYEQLEQSRAVVALISPDWIASRWCHAELAIARSQGKVIVPVRILGEQRAFEDLQEIDLRNDSEEAQTALLHALRAVFPWDPARSPYPGLLNYTENDAAVFFGRDQETVQACEQLESLRRRGDAAARLVVLLGGSGSGKSSLLRAGVLPRLRPYPDRWLILPVLQARSAPLDELATALAASAAGDLVAMRAALADAASPRALLDLVDGLRVKRRAPSATVLLPIDQAEQLFVGEGGEQTARCLELLRFALLLGEGRFMVVATMRSDFLGVFHAHPFLREDEASRMLSFDKLVLGPMPASRLREVIRGPARQAGVHVEDRLVGDLITSAGAAQAHAADDSLPLLAFTLRRLWDADHHGASLTAQGLKDLKGVEGSIQVAAEQAVAGAEGDPARQRALRAAFVPGLVRIGREGQPVRYRAHRDELPHESHAALQGLVDARLLVADQDAAGRATLEVAHEALFRVWPLLASWIEEDRSRMQALEGLRLAAEEWHVRKRREDLLVHGGLRLAEISALTDDPGDGRFRPAPGSIAADYLEACRAAQFRRDAEAKENQDRKLRDARKIVFRTVIGLVGSVVLLIGLAITLWMALDSRERARDQSLLALASSLLRNDPTRAGLVLGELRRPERIFGLRSVAMELLAQPQAFAEFQHDAAVRWADLSADGQRVATASADRTAVVWRTDTGARLLTLRHDRPVREVRFSPDGQRIAAVLDDGKVQLWTAAGVKVAGNIQHDRVVVATAFSPRSEHLVTGSFDGSVTLWPAAGQGAEQELRTSLEEAVVTAVVFDSAGQHVAAASRDGRVQIWRLADGAPAGTACRVYDAAVIAAGFAEDGSLLSILDNGTTQRWSPGTPLADAPCPGGRTLSPSADRTLTGAAFDAKQASWVEVRRDGSVHLNTSTGAKLSLSTPQAGRRIVRAWLSSQGDRVVGAGADGTAWLWRGGAQPPEVLAGHEREVEHAIFGADGRTVVTSSNDGVARLWDNARQVSGKVMVPLAHERNVNAVDASAEDRVLTAANNGEAHLWTLTGERVHKFVHRFAVTRARFDVRGKRVLTIAGGQVMIWSPRQERGYDRDARLGVHDADDARFSPDGRHVLLTLTDGRGVLADLSAQQPGQPLPTGGTVSQQSFEPKYAATFDHRGNRLLAGLSDAEVGVWRVADPATPLVLQHGVSVVVRDAVFSPDDRLVATAASDGMVRVWSAADGERPRHELRHPASVQRIAFSPDSERVVTVADDGIVRMWEKAGARPLLMFAGLEPKERVSSLQFSADGQLILAAAERKARVWSADGTGDPLVLDARSKATLKGAVFSRDAKHVLTGSADSRAHIWTIAPAALLKIIRARTHVCLPVSFRVRHLLESPDEAQRQHLACERASHAQATSH